MRITIDMNDFAGVTVRQECSGTGYLWTPDPERALSEVRTMLERYVAARIALARDGCARHVRVLAGECPTCGLPSTDCVGVEL